MFCSLEIVVVEKNLLLEPLLSQVGCSLTKIGHFYILIIVTGLLKKYRNLFTPGIAVYNTNIFIKKKRENSCRKREKYFN